MSRFDILVDRKSTNTEKYARYAHLGDVIPAWVADMDFLSPECVINALQQRVNHGVFGYTHPPQSLLNATKNFIKRHYNWEIETEWIVWSSGVVPSMNIVCGMLEDNESVITTTPIYPYFLSAPKNMGKEVVAVPMREIEGRWSIDFDEFEAAITPTCKLMLLCNPYNPGGTVFTCKELTRLGEIAVKHDMLICSDEIHADLLLKPDLKHTPIASLSEELAQRTITLLAPSKTFNIAGLQCSYAVIPNSTLRQRFIRSMGHINGGVNLLGLTAGEAAYEGGDGWLLELRQYLRSNLALVQEFVAKHPALKMLEHEATFLAWIDCRVLNTNAYELFLKHGVVLTDGAGFGDKNFVRLNFGCPRNTLIEILRRMDNALHVKE